MPGTAHSSMKIDNSKRLYTIRIIRAIFSSKREIGAWEGVLTKLFFKKQLLNIFDSP